jgi:hypothetical protein
MIELPVTRPAARAGGGGIVTQPANRLMASTNPLASSIIV